MQPFSLLTLHAFSLLLAACTTMPRAPATTTTFVVTRHAQKDDDGTRDPPLSSAGLAHAQSLAKQLADAPLVAVYATSFKRTQQAAQPSATEHGLDVITYDAATPAAQFAARLRASHSRGTVLVVGHSNTVPAIATALCDCAVAPLGEQDYGRIYTIRIGSDDRAALLETVQP